ncbi:DoxX-like family protein [Acinetobacter shaoyimingii]|uniref:DoxX-like family protein n=1 Tax=Acinetobacter shaoyimingii TaxID=2715164 RepID=A0A6G8RSM0_9GAMM|nr:DoxX-like family protein [Acinetobacter shaoyimingii]NHB56613.1 hypothetical protein [Acinetobacter shaoyimingii]QIO04885.1 hypothetical protein G8E00_02325 [Acinetobacter shaoyimingii]
MQSTLSSILRTLQLTLAILWIYQGLVPKIIYQVNEEHLFWQYTGIQFLTVPTLITLSGMIEIVFGSLFLLVKKSILLHVINIVGLTILMIIVGIIYPQYFYHAFNPVVMNIAMITLSIIAIQILHSNKKMKDITYT